MRALGARDDDDLVVSGSAHQAEEILALVRFREMVDAELLRRIAVFDRTNGFGAVRCRSTHGFLRVHAQLAAGHAKHLVSTAERLDRLVTVRAAQAAGELSSDQAEILAKELAPIEDAEARQAAEELMVAQAPNLHLTQLRQAARQIHAHLVPEDGPEVGEAPPAFQSWVKLSPTGTSDDPFWVLSGELSPVAGEKLRTALEAAMGRPAEGDQRNASERMGDALEVVTDLALASDELPTTGCQRPHLTITADLDALRASCPAHPMLFGVGGERGEGGEGDELAGLVRPRAVATTARGYQLPRWEARKESCDCALRVILTRGQDKVVSIGRTTRTVPAHLRDAVVARDRHCVWPGCDRPPTWCEAHHLVHWADGGETSLANLALLCGEHHRDLHATGWELRMIDGRPRPVLPADALPPNSRYAA
ncbi:HNH endonuclease signature motif containing protein [Streptacidiphilus anmyonensis]|uniref:HNH endonuclease signature motif containing protein n=1 Tax=Streptacidiphilus anmyonensis TaxID=405782 RepID=UPI000693F83E|nr:HNH endonuclease signature motif containing protein [Streptacidiphilus anmyonensis]